MRRSRLALGAGVALSLAAGLASGCTGPAPAAGPGARPAATAAGPHPASTATATAQATAAGGGAASSARTQPGRPAPAGFWTGTDSWPVPVTGHPPYRAPGVGGPYGGYVGMAGSWSYWLGCHG